MKHVSILVPNSPCILSSVIGAYKILTSANSALIHAGKKPAFDVKMVGLNHETSLYDGLFSVRPEILMQDVDKTDLIIIPAFNGDISWGLQQNSAYIPWIIQQYKQGAEVASLCTGAFFIGSSSCSFCPVNMAKGDWLLRSISISINLAQYTASSRPQNFSTR